MPVLVVTLIGLAALAGLLLARGRRRAQRADFIRQYRLPPGLLARLRRHRPQLDEAQCRQIERGLRQFFLAYLHGGRRFVAMPSQAVDDLWHEFILHTRHYEQFCRQAFGGFLHHTPAAVLSADQRGNAGLRRVWRQCCALEAIDPRKPSRLPLLFALDASLGLADGFHYTPDCAALREQARQQGGDGGGSVHCGAELGCADTGGGSSDSSSDSDGSSDGGGDGGCGGGGCGGGD